MSFARASRPKKEQYSQHISAVSQSSVCERNGSGNRVDRILLSYGLTLQLVHYEVREDHNRNRLNPEVGFNL